MKMVVMLACVAIVIFLAGCQEKEIAANEKGEVLISRDAEVVDLVVDRHGELTNEERFKEFLSKIAQGKNDHIQITTFTTEGDPIQRKLSFDGIAVKSALDSTEDSYGSGEVMEMMCKTIEEEESADRIEYFLKGCGETSGDEIVLVKWKQQKKMDLRK